MDASATVGNPLLNIGIFLVFVLATMIIVFRASRNNKTAADYYAAGRSFTGPQNGAAIAGDYLSAASFLGICGAIAINGYDGFLYSIGFLVAWLVALLLVAELLRNTGKFTMADVLSFRLKQRPVRIAAATTTLVVCFFYLLAQMAGAGGLVSLLLGIPDRVGQSVVIAVVGALMIIYVLVGGMKGTTWVQIIKAVLLIAGAFVMSVWVLAINGFNLSTLLGRAVETAGTDAILSPGLQYGVSALSRLDFLSLGLALVLGTAALPHVLMRFYTVPTAKEARRSVVWAIWLIGIFYVFTLILGYGAAALIGADAIKAAPGGANSAAPLLAFELGGPVLLGIISAVAFATILAVVAGLTITAATSFAHDIYGSVIKKGKPEPGSEVKVAPAHGAGDRHRGDHRRHRGERPERGVPRGARLRCRGVGEPADDRLLAVLEAVQHSGRALEHVRRTRGGDHPDRLLARRLGSADQRSDGSEHLDDPGRRLPLVAAQQPGHRVHPARVPARLARDDHRPQPGGCGQAVRDGSALAHRHRCGRSNQALTAGGGLNRDSVAGAGAAALRPAPAAVPPQHLRAPCQPDTSRRAGRVVPCPRALSAVGSAPRSHRGGQEFESPRVHDRMPTRIASVAVDSVAH